MRRIVHLLVYLLPILSGLFLSMNLRAQDRTVTGKVTGVDGAPLVGVLVTQSGTTIGTQTNLEGNFTITVSGKNPELLFSYLGYRDQAIALQGQTRLDVKMEEDQNFLDEVVVVGYGSQKKVSITGAVNVVKPDDLAIGATSSLATSLTGRLPGLVIVQNSGIAGAGASAISIRGASESPLILVDGIERDFEGLDADEIESITILKDASATAVYGIRGGNGVMIVTTKRGQDGKFKINFKAEGGLIHRGKAPQMMDSYTYAMLKNEGTRNDNFIALDDETFQDPYSVVDLALYKNGKAPLTHPSHNWMDYLTNEFGYREKYGVNISGGNKFFKTFTSVDFSKERDVYRSFNVDYNDKSTYQRFNVRSNIDLNITKTTLLSFDLGGQFANRNKPAVDFQELTKMMFRCQPNLSTIYDGKIIFTEDAKKDENPIYMIYNSGFNRTYSNSLQFAVKLNQNLDFITKGLSFNASFSYDHSFSNTYSATRTAAFYYPAFTEGDTVYPALSQTIDPETGNVLNPLSGEWVPQTELPLLSENVESKLFESRSTGPGIKNVNFRANLNYARTWGNHSLGAIAVFTTNSRSYHNGEEKYVPYRYMEAAARLSYNYDDRYFIEFNAGYNGSETFTAKKRFGFFPAVSAGWVLTDEPFFPRNKVLSFFKIRGSYGTTGIDTSPNRFMYYDSWSLSYTGGYQFGLTPAGFGSAYQTTAANLNVSWATNYQANVALESSWVDDRLKINADFYLNRKKGIMMMPNIVPSIVAGNLVAENIKEMKYYGYELEAKWSDRIGNFSYSLFGNLNFAEVVNVYIDEVIPEYPWLVLTGKNPNQILALDCVGFYTQEEIDFLNAYMASTGGSTGTPEVPSSEYASFPLQAGDLKYADLNKDGVINDYDKMYFENTSVPKTTYSFGGSLKWKNFGLTLFFQGAADVSYNLSGGMRIPYGNGTGNGPAYIVNRWTQERFDNGEKILFPRMTGATNPTDHNFVDSSFWFKDASYIRLKNVELSYKLKTKGLNKKGIDAISFVVSGTNIFTWSKLNIYNIDPETKSGGNIPIPPNSVYTLGVTLSF